MDIYITAVTNPFASAEQPQPTEPLNLEFNLHHFPRHFFLDKGQ